MTSWRRPAAPAAATATRVSNEVAAPIEGPAPGSAGATVQPPTAAALPAPARPSALPAAAAPARPSPGTTPPRGLWSERLADGDAAGILAEARGRGIGNVLGAASSEDLAALADAARFRMQDRLARRVLLAQRARFAGTLRATEASFLLGRLADGHGAGASDALAWYERYLDEAPSGTYAAEAMGRMMVGLERQQRVDEARALAGTYLRRFPDGVYARAAHELTAR